MVTLQVPRSCAELLEAVAGFPSFAIGFAMLVMIWYQHRRFFAAHPLADDWTVALNSLLLFVVLLYVYPLKLLAEVFTERFLGAAPAVLAETGPTEIQGLFLIFGAGWVAVFAVFAALHGRAWRMRHALGLDELERYELRHDGVAYVALALIGLLSVLVAALGLGLDWGLPGLFYLLTLPFTVVHQLLTGRRRRQLQASREHAAQAGGGAAEEPGSETDIHSRW